MNVLFPAGSTPEAPAEHASPGKAALEAEDTGRKVKELSSPPKAHRKADAMQALPSQPYTLHPTPYTIHPTPYTLHPTPYTLHPTLFTLHPTPYALHPNKPCMG